MAADEQGACVHYWMLGTSGRESTPAVCRTCGVEREFQDAYRPLAPGRAVRKPVRKEATELPYGG